MEFVWAEGVRRRRAIGQLVWWLSESFGDRYRVDREDPKASNKRKLDAPVDDVGGGWEVA